MDLQERDEQAKAICNVYEEPMGDEIDCDCEYTETDPISPAELAAGSGAQLNTTFAFHEVTFAGCPAPRSASHLSLSLSLSLLPRGECS